ncbi:MAG: SOS response-associated peptidase [Ancrocorticia sp.]|jgi:putative SOS response-associated peptidase YedK|nr:SOS response-associated peptidase [Ancrocorticia sp.]MCI1932750.1 SOS response-associated peptidase [Ancrocorticia sp.]
MTVRDVQLAFDIDSVGAELERYAPSWNVAPGQDIGVVLDVLRPAPAAAFHASETVSSGTTSAVHRELHLARWGLIAPWATTLETARPLINARAETLTAKPSFKEAVAKRRCLIPANGYFEWQEAGKQKLPYYITDTAPLAFAGLYNWWRAPDHSWLLTAVIITGPARSPLDAIHDRTPIVLEPDEWAKWLDPALTDGGAAADMLRRPNRPLTAYRVSHIVGNPRNNSPANIAALTPSHE